MKSAIALFYLNSLLIKKSRKEEEKPMQKKKLTAKGFFVYQDEQGRDIYYDPFKKTGYYLREEHLKTLSFYQNRFFLLLAGCFLAYNFLTKSLLALAIFFVGFLVLWEFVFRSRYLAKLQVAPNFVPSKKQSILDRMVREEAPEMLLLRAILYIILAILLPWNAYESLRGELWLFAGSLLLALGALGNGLFYIYAFFKRKNAPVPVETKTKKRKKK